MKNTDNFISMAIVLEKSGDQHRINLEKGGASSMGEIIINLNWSKGSLMKQIFGKAVSDRSTKVEAVPFMPIVRSIIAASFLMRAL